MKKNYILDTNVLLHDPTALHKFQDNHVIIPLKVLEEIDHFKRDQSELGRNARHVARMLDTHRQAGKLSDGVPLPSGGSLRIAFPGDRDHFNGMSADDQILKLALDFNKRLDGPPVIVVSKDINMRLKADAIGLDAEDYESDRIDISELYPGHTEIDVPVAAIETFRTTGKLPLDVATLSPNEYLTLRNEYADKFQAA